MNTDNPTPARASTQVSRQRRFSKVLRIQGLEGCSRFPTLERVGIMPSGIFASIAHGSREPRGSDRAADARAGATQQHRPPCTFYPSRSTGCSIGLESSYLPGQFGYDRKEIPDNT